MVTITGSIEVTSQSYNSAQGDNGGGGGLASNYRAIDIAGWLSGAGQHGDYELLHERAAVVSCPTNTYSGEWIVQCGWLQGTSANSLGTNSSILVNPSYTGYLAAMPKRHVSPIGPALFEADYDLNTTGTLTLMNGGQMNLHQNCTFTAVTIEGIAVEPRHVFLCAALCNLSRQLFAGRFGQYHGCRPRRPSGSHFCAFRSDRNDWQRGGKPDHGGPVREQRTTT